MKNLKLTKMTGAGNDFLMWNEELYPVESYFKAFKASSRSELTKRLCDRSFGIGADGLVILKNTKDSLNAVVWDFYNADGSHAEMCGNASRCAARYALDNKFVFSGQPIEIKTLAGSVFAEVLDLASVKVEMTKIETAKIKQKLKLAHHQIEFDYIDSGVPHVVIQKNDIILNDILKTLCQEIRNNPLFSPKGTNVTLYKKIDSGHIQSVSYERGVEDFTLACGTGAVAAAYSYRCLQPEHSYVKVDVPGGQLFIEFDQNKVYMTGPAEYIADIDYSYNKGK